MLRILKSAVQASTKGILLNNLKSATVASARSHQSYGGGFLSEEPPEVFDARFIKYFSRPDIDGYELRQGINELFLEDLVPDPTIIVEALKACRRVNDYSLAIRLIEAVRSKCGGHVDVIFPYVMQEIKPTMDELGLDTLETLGYDKPELALVDPDDIH